MPIEDLDFSDLIPKKDGVDFSDLIPSKPKKKSPKQVTPTPPAPAVESKQPVSVATKGDGFGGLTTFLPELSKPVAKPKAQLVTPPSKGVTPLEEAAQITPRAREQRAKQTAQYEAKKKADTKTAKALYDQFRPQTGYTTMEKSGATGNAQDIANIYVGGDLGKAWNYIQKTGLRPESFGALKDAVDKSIKGTLGEGVGAVVAAVPNTIMDIVVGPMADFMFMKQPDAYFSPEKNRIVEKAPGQQLGASLNVGGGLLGGAFASTGEKFVVKELSELGKQVAAKLGPPVMKLIQRFKGDPDGFAKALANLKLTKHLTPEEATIVSDPELANELLKKASSVKPLETPATPFEPITAPAPAQTVGESSAIQIKKPATSVLREERPQVGLPRNEQGNAQIPTGEGQAQAKAETQKIGGQMLWRNADTDIPVEATGVVHTHTDGKQYAEVIIDGKKTYVPASELFPNVMDAGRVAPKTAGEVVQQSARQNPENVIQASDKAMEMLASSRGEDYADPAVRVAMGEWLTKATANPAWRDEVNTLVDDLLKDQTTRTNQLDQAMLHYRIAENEIERRTLEQTALTGVDVTKELAQNAAEMSRLSQANEILGTQSSQMLNQRQSLLDILGTNPEYVGQSIARNRAKEGATDNPEFVKQVADAVAKDFQKADEVMAKGVADADMEIAQKMAKARARIAKESAKRTEKVNRIKDAMRQLDPQAYDEAIKKIKTSFGAAHGLFSGLAENLHGLANLSVLAIRTGFANVADIVTILKEEAPGASLGEMLDAIRAAGKAVKDEAEPTIRFKKDGPVYRVDTAGQVITEKVPLTADELDIANLIENTSTRPVASSRSTVAAANTRVGASIKSTLDRLVNDPTSSLNWDNLADQSLKDALAQVKSIGAKGKNLVNALDLERGSPLRGRIMSLASSLARNVANGELDVDVALSTFANDPLVKRAAKIVAEKKAKAIASNPSKGVMALSGAEYAWSQTLKNQGLAMATEDGRKFAQLLAKFGVNDPQTIADILGRGTKGYKKKDIEMYVAEMFANSSVDKDGIVRFGSMKPQVYGSRTLAEATQKSEALKQRARYMYDKASFASNKGMPLVLEMIQDVGDLMRQSLATLDLSAAGRQNAFFTLNRAFSKNGGLLKDFNLAIKLGKDPVMLKKLVQDYAETEEGKVAAASGLWLSEVGDITKSEEAYSSKILKDVKSKLDESKVLDPIRGAVNFSENNYVAQLNLSRMRAWRDFIQAMGGDVSAISRGDLQGAAKFINAATGRGAYSGGEVGRFFLFSPRFLSSRFEMIGKIGVSGMQTPEGKRYIRNEYLKFGRTLAAMIGMVHATGGEFETDPRSAKYGKARWRNFGGRGTLELDMTGGMADMVRIAAQMTTGAKKRGSGMIQPLREGTVGGVREGTPVGQGGVAETALNFMLNRTAPVPRMAWVLGTGKNPDGTKVAEMGISDWLRQISPLTIGDTVDMATEFDIAPAMLAGVLNSVGFTTRLSDPLGLDVPPDVQSLLRDGFVSTKMGDADTGTRFLADVDAAIEIPSYLPQKERAKVFHNVSEAVSKAVREYAKEQKIEPSVMYMVTGKDQKKLTQDQAQEMSKRVREAIKNTVASSINEEAQSKQKEEAKAMKMRNTSRSIIIPGVGTSR